MADGLPVWVKPMISPMKANLEAVTIDMSGAYIKAVTEASPQATLIFEYKLPASTEMVDDEPRISAPP